MKPAVTNSTPGEILRTPGFYLLWVIYFIGAGAGLMVIGSISGMAKASMGELAFVAVALFVHAGPVSAAKASLESNIRQLAAELAPRPAPCARSSLGA